MLPRPRSTLLTAEINQNIVKALGYNLIFNSVYCARNMDDAVYTEQQLDLITKTDQLFIERIPFNQYLGMKVDQYGEHTLKIRIDIRQQLVGNFTRDMLHGGVTLSLLDAVGGMQVLREVIKRLDQQTEVLIKSVLSKVSTINLNAQFLRPGIGQSFYATAIVRRLGSKVAFVDMQMMNQDHLLIATGSGVYSVS